MIPIKLPYLFIAAVPVQFGFFALHLILAYRFPQMRFQREILPLAYLAATYLQWLAFSFFISWRTKKYRVPLLMHIPHLMSFLPLVRHVMIAADRGESDSLSLLLAWIHAVTVHCFSLVAAWLWQMRHSYEAEGSARRDLIPIAVYAILALTTIIVYAGLDFSFAPGNAPFAVGSIQLLLMVAITGLLLFREGGRVSAVTLIPAVLFSLVNGLLLFDRARSDMGVELALAGASFTQVFSLYVFLHYSRSQRATHEE